MKLANDVKVQRARRALDEEITALQQQAALARRRPPRHPAAGDAAPSPAQAHQEQPLTGDTSPSPATQVYSPSSTESLDADQTSAIALITNRTDHLQDIRKWLTEDGDLLPLIAKVVGDIEGTYLRRNVIVNILLSTVFLIAGWLLSTVATPGNLVRLFGH
jgi:hypothetical protein